MPSLIKATQLIQKAVANQSEGLSFTELIEDTDIARASAHRILKECVSVGLLTFDEEQKKYRGGVILAALGAQVIANYDFRLHVRPMLKKLHDELGHVVTLSIRQNDVGIYMDKIEAKDLNLKLHSQIGKAFPLHCTAMGKIHLAHAPSDILREVLSGTLERHTPNTITDKTELRVELEKIHSDGYAMDNEEITRGLSCVAAPILGPEGEVAGAMSFTCPTYYLEEAGQRAIINRVKDCAQLASY